MPDPSSSTASLEPDPARSFHAPGASAEMFEPPVARRSSLQSAVKWFRGKLAGREETSLKDVIEEALGENGHSGMTEEERTLLKNVVAFGELSVKDIMVPRTDILALERDTSLDELLAHIKDIGHTRVPVYHESLDKIEGFIHVKDLFAYISHEKAFSIADVLREILFVPPSMRIVDLLLKMRMSGCHMAVVVDEYGGTDGLVTMEDLFEEIVGEIQDEHDDDQAEALFRWVNDHVLEVDARAPIGEVETVLQCRLRPAEDDEPDYDTFGGYIFSHLGRVPAKGEIIARHDLNMKIDITAADPRRIHKARIVRLSKLATPAAGA